MYYKIFVKYTIVPGTVPGTGEISKFTNTLPTQSLQIFIILHDKKSQDRAALPILISQVLYFHRHPRHVNFPIGLLPHSRKTLWNTTSHHIQRWWQPLKKRHALSYCPFKNIQKKILSSRRCPSGFVGAHWVHQTKMKASIFSPHRSTLA